MLRYFNCGVLDQPEGGEGGGWSGSALHRAEVGRLQRGGHHQRVPRREHDEHAQEDRRPQAQRDQEPGQGRARHAGHQAG